MEQMEQKQLSHRELLEKGLMVFRKILDQPVTVTREEMCDLLNFEIAVNAMVTNLKSIENKTPEELIEMAKKNLSVDVDVVK